MDSKVIIQENHLKVGDITNMMITGIAGYDLTGTPVHLLQRHKGAKGQKNI